MKLFKIVLLALLVLTSSTIAQFRIGLTARTRIPDSSITWIKLSSAVMDSIIASGDITSVAAGWGLAGGSTSGAATLRADSTYLMTLYKLVTAIRDSLARYTTNYKIDTLNIDSSMFESFIRGHQTTGVTEVGYSDLADALQDSLASYASHIKIVNTNPHGLNDNSVTYAKLDTSATGFIDVRKFGALGDNSTDNTTAIQNAIDFAATGRLTGNFPMTVYIPQGIYLVSQLVLKPYVSLVGDGCGGSGAIQVGTSTIKQIAGSNKDLIQLDVSHTTNFHWTQICDLDLAGDTTATYGNGIFASDPTGEGTSFRRIRFTGFSGSGIKLTGGTMPLVIDNCFFYSNDTAGVYIYNTQATMSNCETVIQNISGDNNGMSLIYLRGMTTNNTGGNVFIHGVKCEPGIGRTPNVIDLHNFGGGYVLINSVYFSPAVGVTANSIIRIRNDNGVTVYPPNVEWSGLVTNERTSYYIHDTVTKSVASGVNRDSLKLTVGAGLADDFLGRGSNFHNYIGGGIALHMRTLEINDTSPSVFDGSFYKTANTTTTNIIDFNDGDIYRDVGKVLTIYCDDNYTGITDNASIDVAGISSGTIPLISGSIYSFIKVSNSKWRQLSQDNIYSKNIYCVDSLKIGSTSDIWARKLYYNAADSSVALQFYNTTLSRLDTVYQYQYSGGGGGGGDVGAGSIDSTKLAADAVTSTKIKNGEVQHWDLATALKDSLKSYTHAPVDSTHLGLDAVTSVRIKNGTIKNEDVSATAAIAGSKVTPDFRGKTVYADRYIQNGDTYAYDGESAKAQAFFSNDTVITNVDVDPDVDSWTNSLTATTFQDGGGDATGIDGYGRYEVVTATSGNKFDDLGISYGNMTNASNSYGLFGAINSINNSGTLSSYIFGNSVHITNTGVAPENIYGFYGGLSIGANDQASLVSYGNRIKYFNSKIGNVGSQHGYNITFSGNPADGKAAGSVYGFSLTKPSAWTRYNNVFGVYLPDVSGAVSRGWSIYSAGGRMFHAGQIGVGDSTYSHKLTVSGGIFADTLMTPHYKFPHTDGTSGQVLQTNGSGALSWETVTSGGLTEVSYNDFVQAVKDSLKGYAHAPIDSTHLGLDAVTSVRIKNGEVRYWDLASAIQDSLKGKGNATKTWVSATIADSLAPYMTDFKLDTTKTDTSQWGPYIRDHQSATGGGLAEVAYDDLVQALKDSLAGYAHAPVDSAHIGLDAITSVRIKNGDVRYWDLSTALQDSLKNKGNATDAEVAKAITDSLDVYRTSFKLDTTKIDTAMFGKFVRDHQTDVAASDPASAISDSLARYTTNFKLDTVAIDTSMWGKFVRDHEASDISWASAISDSLARYVTDFKLDTTAIDTTMFGKFVRDHEASPDGVGILAAALTDSLDAYRTSFLLDTTKIDTAMFGKFVRDHEASPDGVGVLAAALTDSLDAYRTDYMLDTTKVDTAQWGKFVRDHEATGLLPVDVASQIADSLNAHRTDYQIDTTKIADAQWSKYVKDNQENGIGDLEVIYSITIDSTAITTSRSIPFFYVSDPVTIDTVIVVGATAGTAAADTFHIVPQISHDDTLKGVIKADVLDTPGFCNSKTVGTRYTSFSDATLTYKEWAWVRFTTVTKAPQSIMITVIGRK